MYASVLADTGYVIAVRAYQTSGLVGGVSIGPRGLATGWWSWLI